MRIALAALLVLSLSGCASVPVGEIDALSIPPGTQARMVGVNNPTNYVRLSVLGATPDSLRYRLNDGALPRSLSWQRIDRLDVAGRHSNFGRGAGIGVVLGLLGGVSVGASHNTTHGNTRSGLMIFGGVVGAVGGGVLGAVAGLATRTEMWIPVSIPRPSSANPGGDR